MSETVPPSFFEDLYARKRDPWDFETSAYEAAKYQDTVDTLPRTRYKQALEIGCSIGVLTAQLAGKCDSLLSIDLSERALAIARERCRDLPNVRFRRMMVPHEFPEGEFDLLVVSDVAYYWSEVDLGKSKALIAGHHAGGGHLILVHWTPFVTEHVQTGDAVHETWLKDSRWRLVQGARREKYRIDLLERVGEAG